MSRHKRPWSRAEKWFGALTIAGVAALAVWGWIDSRPLPPRLAQPHGAYVQGFLLSPDQNFLAVNADVYDGYSAHTGAVTLWNARTLKAEPIFRTSKLGRKFCVSNDAAQIGTFDELSKRFEWRDRATQRLLWSFVPPKSHGFVDHVLFLKHKSQILLIARGNAISKVKPRAFLLAARDGSVQASWDSDTPFEYKSAFSPDGKWLVYRETRSKSLIVRRVDDGKIVRRWKSGRFGGIPVISRDGRFFFSLGESTKAGAKLDTNAVNCLDLRTGRQVWSFDAIQVASDINAWRRAQTARRANIDIVAFASVAISSDGDTVAVIRVIDSTIYLLDAKTGKLRKHLALPLGKAEYSGSHPSSELLFAPDGKHLFAHTSDSIFAWDLD